MPHTNGSAKNGAIDTSNGTVIDVEKLAVSPNSPEKIPDLLAQIASHGREYLAEGSQARLKLLEAARSLTYALETPREAMIRHCWSQVCATIPAGGIRLRMHTVHKLCRPGNWR